MLKAQQLISSLNEDKSIKYAQILDAFYFEHGEKDPVEEFTSKIGKDKTEYKYSIPKSETTKTDPQELLVQAINDAQARFPKENPVLKILSGYSDLVNTAVKNSAKAILEPVDLESAISKQKTLWSKMGVSLELQAQFEAAQRAELAKKSA